jgi:hypothetical protein
MNGRQKAAQALSAGFAFASISCTVVLHSVLRSENFHPTTGRKHSKRLRDGFVLIAD